MARRRASRRAQRGMALMALLAVAVMVFAYVLTSRLNAASRFVGVDRDQNAMVLARAKRALIGYVAQQASLSSENNPGRLPCPEAPGDFNTVNEGRAAGNCNLPAVGRLPWRTLGLEKLVDSATEPLWYVVSPGWALSNATVPPLQTRINSDSPGQLTLDGVANDAIALIIAPGPATSVRAGGPCANWTQSRPTAGPPDVRNYLECGNEAANYVTASPGNTFNDQVLRVSAADLMPALEAAIADRMQREIAPALRTVYGDAVSWGTSATNPLYPFATPFSNPGTSDYRAADGNYQGLLPFTSSAAGCGADPRCSSTFVSWAGVAPTMSASNGIIVASACNFPSASTAQCTGTYLGIGIVTLRMNVRANNVAMALRTLAPGNMVVEYGLVPYGPPGPGTSASGTFNTDGSANLTLNASVPGLVNGLGVPLNVFFRVTANLSVIADHALLDPADPTTGWFVRNEWFRLTYYAAAQQSTADGLPTYGCDGTNCLRYNGAAPRNIRALLVLAGQSLSNPAGRPNGTLADYVEYQNADLGTLYEQRPRRASKVSVPAINAPFNDRLILVDWIAPAPTFPVATLP